MNSNWFQCRECYAMWFFQFESGEAALRCCTACGSELVETLNNGSSGPAGGGSVGYRSDPDREVMEMIRQAFGPQVTELDPSERWIPIGALAAAWSESLRSGDNLRASDDYCPSNGKRIPQAVQRKVRIRRP